MCYFFKHAMDAAHADPELCAGNGWFFGLVGSTRSQCNSNIRGMVALEYEAAMYPAAAAAVPARASGGGGGSTAFAKSYLDHVMQRLKENFGIGLLCNPCDVRFRKCDVLNRRQRGRWRRRDGIRL